MDIDALWFEKTVEYRFVTQMFNEGLVDFAAPLAGLQEVGGDGIFAKDAALVLIEFKRTVDDCRSERTKYHGDNFAAIAAAMRRPKPFHFNVYGYLDAEQKRLELGAHAYFSPETSSSVSNIMDRGVTIADFREYLRQLVQHKKVDGRSGARVPISTFSSVVGATSRGTWSVTLEQYCKIVEPQLANELTFELSPSTRPAPMIARALSRDETPENDSPSP